MNLVLIFSRHLRHPGAYFKYAFSFTKRDQVLQCAVCPVLWWQNTTAVSSLKECDAMTSLPASVSTVAKSSYKNQESELLSRKWWRPRMHMQCERGSRKFKWFFINFSFLSVSWKLTPRCLKICQIPCREARKLIPLRESNFSKFLKHVYVSGEREPGLHSTFKSTALQLLPWLPSRGRRSNSICVTMYRINALKAQRKRLLCLT